MGVPFLVLLAFVWALFGLWGYLRGWKISLLMAGLIFSALLALSLAPDQVKGMFDKLNQGVKFFTSSDKTLIDTAPTNLAFILLVGGVLGGFLLSMLKTLRGKPAFLGFMFGILDGYLFSAYTLATLVPGRAILPLPIKVAGLADVPLKTAVAAPPSSGLIAEINTGLQQAAQQALGPTAILLFIIGFILLIVLTGGRGGKKG